MTQPNPTPEPGATPPTGANPAGSTTAPEPAKNEPAKPAEPAAGDGLGEAGKKALEAERAARKDLEKRLAALEPLSQLAAALGVKPEKGQTDVQTLTEQVAAMQKQMAESELRALRLEVAAEKSLTPAQAARLHGATREELAADADALKALFPTAPAAAAGTNGSGTPAPDPTQGPRGGVNELQARLKAAQEKGDTREAIRLKTEIAAQTRTS